MNSHNVFCFWNSLCSKLCLVKQNHMYFLESVKSWFAAKICLHKSTKKKEGIPSRELRYPTLGKKNHLQKWFLMGYVSSLKGTPVNPKQCPTSIKQCGAFPSPILPFFQVDGVSSTREVRCFFCAFWEDGVVPRCWVSSPPETNSQRNAPENRPLGPQNESIARWWFQIFFNFYSYQGKIPILTNIFQTGWNHQPDSLVSQASIFTWEQDHFRELKSWCE